MHERDNTNKNTNKRKFGLSETIAAAAIAGVVVSPLAVDAAMNRPDSHPQAIERVISNEEAAAIKHDAEMIANKYASCAVTDVSDLHTDPTRKNGEVGFGPSRTTLSLTLDVERNPEAAEALLRYDNTSDYDRKQDIVWSNPTLAAFVESNGMEIEVAGPGTDYGYEIPDSDIATDGHDPRTASEQFTIKVNPLAIPANKDAKMIFKVTTNASPRALEEPIIANTQECVGTAVYDQSVSGWVLEK